MRKHAPKLPQPLLERTEKLVHDVDIVLTTTIPEKIKWLTQLEADPRFEASRFENYYEAVATKENDQAVASVGEAQEPASKKRNNVVVEKRPENNPFAPCKLIIELNSIVKPELRALFSVCLKLQVWIQLSVPKIEDGNNFGVSVQEAMLEEISRIQQDVGTYLDQFSRYHANRAKMVSKLIKYPNIPDYLITIHEIDDKEFLNLRIICSELANYYHCLLDLLIKNYQKVICPRSEHHGSMF